MNASKTHDADDAKVLDAMKELTIANMESHFGSTMFNQKTKESFAGQVLPTLSQIAVAVTKVSSLTEEEYFNLVPSDIEKHDFTGDTLYWQDMDDLASAGKNKITHSKVYQMMTQVLLDPSMYSGAKRQLDNKGLKFPSKNNLFERKGLFDGMTGLGQMLISISPTGTDTPNTVVWTPNPKEYLQVVRAVVYVLSINGTRPTCDNIYTFLEPAVQVSRNHMDKLNRNSGRATLSAVQKTTAAPRAPRAPRSSAVPGGIHIHGDFHGELLADKSTKKTNRRIGQNYGTVIDGSEIRQPNFAPRPPPSQPPAPGASSAEFAPETPTVVTRVCGQGGEYSPVKFWRVGAPPTKPAKSIVLITLDSFPNIVIRESGTTQGHVLLNTVLRPTSFILSQAGLKVQDMIGTLSFASPSQVAGVCTCFIKANIQVMEPLYAKIVETLALAASATNTSFAPDILAPDTLAPDTLAPSTGSLNGAAQETDHRYQVKNVTMLCQQGSNWSYMKDSQGKEWGRGDLSLDKSTMIFTDGVHTLNVQITAEMDFSQVLSADNERGARRVLVFTEDVEIDNDIQNGGTYGIRGTPKIIVDGLQQRLLSMVQTLKRTKMSLSPLGLPTEGQRLSPLGALGNLGVTADKTAKENGVAVAEVIFQPVTIEPQGKRIFKQECFFASNDKKDFPWKARYYCLAGGILYGPFKICRRGTPSVIEEPDFLLCSRDNVTFCAIQKKGDQAILSDHFELDITTLLNQMVRKAGKDKRLPRPSRFELISFEGSLVDLQGNTRHFKEEDCFIAGRNDVLDAFLEDVHKKKKAMATWKRIFETQSNTKNLVAFVRKNHVPMGVDFNDAKDLSREQCIEVLAKHAVRLAVTLYGLKGFEFGEDRHYIIVQACTGQTGLKKLCTSLNIAFPEPKWNPKKIDMAKLIFGVLMARQI